MNNNEKKIKEKSFNNAEVINLILFPTLTPDDKQWILNYIDEFIINELNIKKEQLKTRSDKQKTGIVCERSF